MGCTAGLWLLVLMGGSEIASVGRAQEQTCSDQCGGECQVCEQQCDLDREWQRQQQEQLARLQEGELSLSEQQKLLSPYSAADNNLLGLSVAVSGRVAIVGASKWPWRYGQGPGVAFAFEKQDDGSWTAGMNLLAAANEQVPTFGHSVAVSGFVAIVGAPSLHHNFGGAVYVFERQENGSWVEGPQLMADDAGKCGWSVAVSGAVDGRFTAIVGCPDRKEAYVFERQEDGGWTEEAVLIAPDRAITDLQFGDCVALAGSVVIVGAPADSAYLFERQEDKSWAINTKVAVSAGRTQSVAVSGSVALVGTPATGEVYVFARQADKSWTMEARLTAVDSEEGNQFGHSVALDGAVAIVGATGHASATGAVYSFERQAAGMWTAKAKLVAADGAAGDEFGWNVALSGSVVIVGAKGDEWQPPEGMCGESCDAASTTYKGSAYIWINPCATFRDTPSVVDDSCTQCTGSHHSECHAATCDRGYVNYQGGHCCHDMANVSSVVTGSCTECTGSAPTECTSATCVGGFGPFSVGACCHSFAAEPSVAENSCTACTGSEASSCSVAICASGYTGYSNGTCCRTPIEERSPSGECQCVDGFYANEETSFVCQPCPEGTASTQDRSQCVCQPGWYEYSQAARPNATALNVPVFCHEATVTSTLTATEEGCIQCGQCLRCSSAARPAVSVPYVRILGSSQSRIDLFRCALRTGCFAVNQIDSTLSGCKSCPEKRLPLTAGCQPHYTGHFCGTCDDTYEMREAPAAAIPGSVTAFECVPCERTTKSDGLAGAAGVGVMVAVVLLKDRVFARLARTRTHMAVFQAYAKSVWQPVRILIT